jgi:hypothetical protein
MFPPGEEIGKADKSTAGGDGKLQNMIYYTLIGHVRFGEERKHLSNICKKRRC